MTSVLTKSQKKTYGPKVYTEDGITYRITAIVRHDDECGNGHNSFAITAKIDRKAGNNRWIEDSCGGCHAEIARQFPELVPFIKYHGMSTDEPLHYIANTVYHAGDKDCWGLRKGERRQIVNSRTRRPVWELVAQHKETGESVPLYKLETMKNADTTPSCEYELVWQSCDRIGKGKERDLNAARSAAVWPDATDEELTAPGLEERLKARLPQLIKEFKEAVESLGFVY